MKPGDRWLGVVNAPLTGPRKAVLNVLACRADQDTGECWISRAKLAKQAGCGMRAVTAAVEFLQAHGWLRRQRPGRTKVNHYYVNFAALEQSRGARGAHHEVHEVHPEQVPEQSARTRRTRKAPLPPDHNGIGQPCKTCHQAEAVLDGECERCIAARSKQRRQRERPPTL